MCKNHEIRLKCNEREFEEISNKADKLGLTLSSFLRACALKFEINLFLKTKSKNVSNGWMTSRAWIPTNFQKNVQSDNGEEYRNKLNLGISPNW